MFGLKRKFFSDLYCQNMNLWLADFFSLGVLTSYLSPNMSSFHVEFIIKMEIYVSASLRMF